MPVVMARLTARGGQSHDVSIMVALEEVLKTTS